MAQDRPLVIVRCKNPAFLEFSLRLLSSLAALVVISAGVAAHADTVQISFDGTENTGIGGSAVGIGSFSYIGSPSALSLSQLTGFNFTATVQATNFPVTVFTYSLSDIEGFSATLNGDVLTSLILLTDPAASSSDRYGPESLFVYSLLPEGAFLGGVPYGNAPQVENFLGQVSQTPEPSSVALLGTGMLCLAGMVRKRSA